MYLKTFLDYLNYFTMSKITSSDFPIKLKEENVSSLCQDTILDYYDLLEQTQFEVDIQIPDTPFLPTQIMRHYSAF
jgi:hypothetical protein